MSTTITGVVTNGVIVPSSPLPEGARVEIQVNPTRPEIPPVALARYTASQLRMMPREKRQAVLEAAAALAEEDYRDDKELTGFDAFREEEVDDKGLRASPRNQMSVTMKKQRLPKGWTQEKIRKLAGHHDNLTDDEHATEIEAGLTEENQTVMVVPTELVPEFVKLIKKRRPT